jgi:heat shock protein HtpX
MSTAYNQKDKNIRLTWVYLTGFLVFVIGVGWIFSQAYGNSLILYGAVAFSIIMNIASYWWSDKIVLKMNKAQEIKPEQGPQAREIYRLVENLAITAGLPMPKVYLMNDPALNAFATGRNPEHAVVALTTGIVERLEKRELEGVIAHELSHIGNRDILLGTVVVVLVGFISILADMFRHSMFFGSGDNDNRNGISVIIGLVLSLLAPFSAMLIQLAISRKREFLADSSGALLTRYPEGLASALEKISADPRPLKTASRATAHMFISSPFKGKKFMKLMATHPPADIRIKTLRSMDI